jgi:hypothetical protein
MRDFSCYSEGVERIDTVNEFGGFKLFNT